MNFIITGASGGIGLETAKILRAAGHRVISLSRSNPEGGADFIRCDVSDPASALEAVGGAAAVFNGRIDGVINNAGVGLYGALELAENAETLSSNGVNFNGTQNIIQAALPYMAKGGRIINISSVCAFFALPYRGMYCAQKAAVNMLSYVYRMELKESGIEVCAVCPGDTKSNFNNNRIRSYKTNERYGSRPENAAKSVDRHYEGRMETSAVAAKIAKLSLKKRLPPVRIIGGKYKFFYFCYKFLPMRAFHAILEKMFGGYKE